jgi:ABC-type phosphate transport system substrate-binding protein
MPPDVLAARLERTIDCKSGSQDVAVPPALVPAVEQVDLSLQGLCPEQSLVPVAEDSAQALVRILDRPATPADIARLSEVCPGDVLSTPLLGSPIGIVVNISGLDGLLLTPEAVAGILNGSITSWTDPLITEANTGFEIPDLPVSLLRLDQPSGAVEAMTTWLSGTAPSAWNAGATATLTSGKALSSYEDIIAEMTGLNIGEPMEEIEVDLEADVSNLVLPGQGTVAVMPTALASENVLPVASLPADGVNISITNNDLPKVGIAAMVLTTDDAGRILPTHAVGGVPVEGQFDQASAKVVFEEGAPVVGWPVIAVSSILACDDPNNPLPKSTAQFFLRLAAQGTFTAVGLTPLPEPIRVQALPSLRVDVAALENASVPDDGGENSSEAPVPGTQ